MTTVATYAEALIRSEILHDKLSAPPPDLVDAPASTPLVLERPGRPDSLRIVSADRAKVPGADGIADPAQRTRLVHGSANHELQAVELFAWALLAFPDAPPAYRRGLLQLLADEQRHCQLYIDRLADWNVRFGDYPVSGYFWNKVPCLTTPLRFICAMCLTFETANLDHSLEFAQRSRQVGDDRSADIFAEVHRDEQRHVRFGWRWLGKLKPTDQSMWDAYRDNLSYPLRPERARGRHFSAEARTAAGLAPDFIANLKP